MHINSKIINPLKLNDRIPLKLSEIIIKALAKNPKYRYQTIDEFIIQCKILINSGILI